MITYETAWFNLSERLPWPCITAFKFNLREAGTRETTNCVKNG